MKAVYEFLKECGIFFVGAVDEDGKRRIRRDMPCFRWKSLWRSGFEKQNAVCVTEVGFEVEKQTEVSI